MATTEKETPWIDAWIRWERDSKAIVGDDEDENENDAPATPTDSFSFRYPLPSSHGDIKGASFVSMELKGFPSESEETWNSTGLTIWRSSHHLCEYLLQHPELVKNKRVVELGSGLGRCGILAHHLGASHAFLTDGDTDTLVQLRRNIEANKDASLGEVACHQLLWGRETALEFLKLHGKPDVVIGSDLIYVPSVITPLFETARTLLDGNDDGIFIMAHCHRRQGSSVNIDMVLEAAEQAGLNHDVVQEEDDISVFCFRLQQQH